MVVRSTKGLFLLSRRQFCSGRIAIAVKGSTIRRCSHFGRFHASSALQPATFKVKNREQTNPVQGGTRSPGFRTGTSVVTSPGSKRDRKSYSRGRVCANRRKDTSFSIKLMHQIHYHRKSNEIHTQIPAYDCMPGEICMLRWKLHAPVETACPVRESTCPVHRAARVLPRY